MQETHPYSFRQLRSLVGMALLSPILRLIPGSAAVYAGRAAWAGPLAALPLLLVYAALLSRLRRLMLPGETLPELCLRALGVRWGKTLLLVLGAWLLLYGGFVLRAGADRLLVTIYPRSGEGIFVVSMALLALLAALGPLRSLLRVARMVEPILLLTLAFILLTAVRDLDRSLLLPLTAADAGALLRGALPSLDILSFALAALCFFRPAQTDRPGSFRRSALWVVGLSLLLTAVGAAIQGRFGAALSTRFSAPFFALVRNLVFFRSLERMEALVVGLWIFPDFLLTGMTLSAAQHCLRLVFSRPPQPGERRLDLGNGRLLIWLCGAGMAALGLILGQGAASLLFWSRTLIPLLQLSVALLLIPGIFLLGKLRGRL